MKRRSWFIALCYLCLLAGCVSPAVPTPSQPAPTSMPRPTLTATLAPTASPTATRFPTRTQTPTATQTSTSTITPTPTISLTPSVTPPPDQYTLSVGNVAQVQELARKGRGRLQSIAWSKDGQLLVLGSSLGFYIYNAQTLELIRYIYTGSGAWEIAISPDGKTIATGNKRIQLWDVDTGTGLDALERSVIGGTIHLEFSSGGSWLAAVGSDGNPGDPPAMFFAWDIKNRELLYSKRYEFGGHSTTFTFSPDGRTIALVNGGYAELFNAFTGEEDKSFPDLQGIGSVGFTPDGRGLVIFTNDDEIQIIDNETAQVRYTQRFFGIINGLALTPDGKTLAIFGANQFWDIDSGKLKFELEDIRENPSPSISPDGARLAAVSGEDLKIWEMETGTLTSVIEWDSVVTSLAFASLSMPVGNQQDVLVTGNSKGQVTISTYFSAEPVKTVDFPGKILAVALDPMGMILAAGVEENGKYRIELFDLVNDRIIQSIEVQEAEGSWGLAFSQDGEAIAAATRAYPWIEAWKVQNGEQLSAPEQKNWLNAGDIGGDFEGHLTRLEFRDESYIVRDLRTESVLVEPSITDKLIYCEEILNYGFSSDGHYFTLGCGWPSFAVWDVSKQQLAHNLPGHQSVTGDGFAASLTDVEFSPYGYLLASSGWDGTIRFWDAHRGRLLLTLSDHNGMVIDIAFSPDGRYLASTSADGTVRMYGLRP